MMMEAIVEVSDSYPCDWDRCSFKSVSPPQLRVPMVLERRRSRQRSHPGVRVVALVLVSLC